MQDFRLNMTLKLHPFLQQREIANYCKANGIIVQAYCPIIRGASHADIDAIAKKVCILLPPFQIQTVLFFS